MGAHGSYYVPEPSYWPIVGSVGLFTTVTGVANWIHGAWFGPYVSLMGFFILTLMMTGWFGEVICESVGGKYAKQEDRSFRMGMVWFIFSEVCFFGAFFGALFYARCISVPRLGGEGFTMTNFVLWPGFQNLWPVLANPDNAKYVAPESTMYPWGLPAINTILLLSSGVTITIAHWALKLNKRTLLNWAMFFTIALGVSFLCLQGLEFFEAYTEKGLTLASGIYGTTFFMLTGFHGMHVTIGSIMLLVILFRCLKGHFTKDNHFAFEAVAWYWHFVDVVWLCLFVLVYWL